MATIDEMYDQLAKAEGAHAPLATLLRSKSNAWNTALDSLGLPSRQALRPYNNITAIAASAAPTVTTADLKAMADDLIATKSAHDVSFKSVTSIRAQIQAAIKAKGA